MAVTVEPIFPAFLSYLQNSGFLTGTAQIVSRELTHPKIKQMGCRLSKLSYGLGRSLDLENFGQTVECSTCIAI